MRLTHACTRLPLARPFKHQSPPCVKAGGFGYLYPRRHGAFVTRRRAIGALYRRSPFRLYQYPALQPLSKKRQNKPRHRQRKNMTAGDREYSSSPGRRKLALGELQVVCSSQTMLCLFIVEVSGQLVRNNGRQFGGNWRLFSCIFLLPYTGFVF